MPLPPNKQIKGENAFEEYAVKDYFLWKTDSGKYYATKKTSMSYANHIPVSEAFVKIATFSDLNFLELMRTLDFSNHKLSPGMRYYFILPEPHIQMEQHGWRVVIDKEKSEVARFPMTPSGNAAYKAFSKLMEEHVGERVESLRFSRQGL